MSRQLIVYLDLNDTLQTTRSSCTTGRFRPQLGEFLQALQREGIDVRVFANQGTLAFHRQINAHLRAASSPAELPLPSEEEERRHQQLLDSLRKQQLSLTCCELLSEQDSRRLRAAQEHHKHLPRACLYRVDPADHLPKDLSLYLSREELSRAVLVDDEAFSLMRSANFGHVLPALKRNPDAASRVRPKDDFRAYSQDWERGLMGRVLPALLALQRELNDAGPVRAPFSLEEAIDHVQQLQDLPDVEKRARGVLSASCEEVLALLRGPALSVSAPSEKEEREAQTGGGGDSLQREQEEEDSEERRTQREQNWRWAAHLLSPVSLQEMLDPLLTRSSACWKEIPGEPSPFYFHL